MGHKWEADVRTGGRSMVCGECHYVPLQLLGGAWRMIGYRIAHEANTAYRERTIAHFAEAVEPIDCQLDRKEASKPDSGGASMNEER